jgi:hypothetical protein
MAKADPAARQLRNSTLTVYYEHHSQMSDGITLDVGSSIPYLVDAILRWFDHDAASLDWKRRIEHLVKLSLTQAAYIQCVGMSAPVPITRIYQPTTLIFWDRHEPADVKKLVKQNRNLVIFAGPGWGKTTFLHWLYIQLSAQDSGVVPVLFTLRWPNARQDLEEFVNGLEQNHAKSFPKAAKLVLLVDGYDEISEEDRKLVSKSLMLLQALNVGNFYLTCRSFYRVYELKSEQCHIAPFTDVDAKHFIKAFSNIYGSKLAPDSLMAELTDHGFSDFAKHPLMLTLVCILKSSANSEIPRRAIGLIRRALDTLTLRWDEQKGVHRVAEVPVDGEERIRCLMRIAYGMVGLQDSEENVQELAREHLRLSQIKGVDVRKLLDELAQWYGILVPLEDANWTFVHRTIHDYLAARFWVESGGFANSPVAKWNTRAAYSACLLPDATQYLCRMLTNESGIEIFAECLYNQPHFNVKEVAFAVLTRMERLERVKEFTLEKTVTHISAHNSEDFYSLVSEEFLIEMATVGMRRGTNASQVAALYALAELDSRKLKVNSSTLLSAIGSLYRGLASNGFPVQVKRKGTLYSFNMASTVSKSV